MPATIYSMAPVTLGASNYAAKSITLSPALVSEPELNSGAVYPSLIRTSGANPVVTLTMPFSHAYAAIGFGVTKLTAFAVYLCKFADFVRSSSIDHARFALSGSSVAAAMITGATVDQDGDLLATVDVVPIADTATTHPLALTTNNAFPSLSGQPLLYTIGPCTLNGTLIPGMTSAGVDLGQNLVPQRSDGSKFPMAAARISAIPRAFGEHVDPITLLGTLTLDGLSASSNFIQYFRSYDATTGVVSNSAGSALSFTMATARAEPLDLSAQTNAVARMGLQFFPTSTSTTHPIAVSTSATVPSVT